MPLKSFIRIFIVISMISLGLAQRLSSAIIFDPHSGKVVAGMNHTRPIFPASLTKLMTLLMVFEALDQGRIGMNTPFRASSLAARQPPCKLGVCAQQSLPVKTCIRSIAIRSANDVAIMVAENLGGLQAFVTIMNQKAKRIGLQNTVFCNPSGLHHPQQRTTSHDIAKLLCFLWKTYPQFRCFLGEPFFVYKGIKKNNTNHLLKKTAGMSMGKTGYTDPAGWNLATLTQRQGKAVIVVATGIDSRLARDKHVSDLIEMYYKNQWSEIQRLLAQKHKPAVCSSNPRTPSIFKKRVFSRSSKRGLQIQRVSCKRKVSYIKRHTMKKNKNGKSTFNSQTGP